MLLAKALIYYYLEKEAFIYHTCQVFSVQSNISRRSQGKSMQIYSSK